MCVGGLVNDLLFQMDSDLEIVLGESPRSSDVGQINGTSSVDHSGMLAACALCQRVIFSDNETVDIEALDICGDCKILLQEELGTPLQDGHRRRMPRVRRVRYNSLESIENLFSQQFSNIINLARQRQTAVFEHENHSLDADAAARLVQHTSSRTTPSGSGRWRRVLSDTESEGIDSLYGESESNFSFNGYRFFHGESDTISFSAYGGESDTSADGHSFMDSELFARPGAGSDIDSDTDIDPMHAGFNQWNSDDQEEEDEDNEWEEADTELNIDHSLRARFQLPRLLSSNANTVPTNWHRQFHSPEFEGTIRLRFGERRQTYIPDIFANLEESELHPFAGNPGDYLDARGFEELIEQLADTDDSRRGAPPAAASFVNSLPSIVVNEELEKQDGLACAICKDSLFVGTVVNQLPCFHLYHPSCILPWLSARSSCPLCRYELPTDDKDHEDRKQGSISGFVIHEIPQLSINEDGSSDISEAAGVCEFSQGTEQGELVNADHAAEISNEQNTRRWFFLAAAAPIVSLVGIVLVLWLGNPLTERREPVYHAQRPHPYHSPLSGPPNQSKNRSKRWWLY